jgi:acetyl esterase/lipase
MTAPLPDEPGDPALCARLRAQVEAPGSYVAPDAVVTEREAPGPHGPIPVRVYRPADQGDGAPLLVWCHGGGWVAGDLAMPEADATAREVATRAEATVVSVDYRLALEGVWFPVPLDDVVAAFRWAVAEAPALGADPSRVSLGGASAGANLAAGAALRLRDEGGPFPTALLLAYPCVHAVLPPPSAELAPKVAAITPTMAFAPEVLTPLVENYLGAPTSEATPYAMPALGDVAGLPPTLILNAEYDGLRASGEAFGAQLAAAGVAVEMRYEPDVAHGHLNSPWLADASFATMAAWVRRTA